ncbi:MAG: AarF/ABC1/UbiB kinase family protein [Paracoccaceae bacterium]|jgi:predicted unusual protein kinase regulating ubiquinone biosynthesis (AarF/ABC1/UbiB family)|nr:AarF/ABC1/UbiB kinase family protein [Paracoccaceae bacterium]
MTAPTIPRGRAVPQSRAGRLAQLGAMTTSIAGGMVAEAARKLSAGERPRTRDLLLTPANARRVADRLAQMRGAAMKVGQLISMEGGDVLPPEWASILARLRDQADFMPPQQLKKVLTQEWGADFLKQFKRFDVHPIAAASIGQVHKAETRDGRHLAVKVQYPGVARSINSDVDNVYGLIKMSGLSPKGLNLDPLMEEAKRQLHEEADYEREARYMGLYAGNVGTDEAFKIPVAQPDLTTKRILSMTFLPGKPIETLEEASQEDRDRAAGLLMDLTLRELFVFRLMQADPNFANYRYDPETRRLILLDFGASRDIAEDVSDGYRAILKAGLARDVAAVEAASLSLGFIPSSAGANMRAKMMEMAETVFAPLRLPGPFDFGDGALAAKMRDDGRDFAMEHEINEIPRVDALFIQRKLGGVYLLAHRLRARVDVNAMLLKHV